MPFTLSHGDQRERYYHPFPGFNAYPLTIALEGEEPATLTYTISERPIENQSSVLFIAIDEKSTSYDGKYLTMAP